MDINTQNIEQIVRAVLTSMNNAPDTQVPSAGAQVAPGVFEELDDAVAAAFQAQKALHTVAMRNCVVQAIRDAGEKHARELAELAVQETGMGRVDDKIAKNVAQARFTPGTECLSPEALSGDNGLTLIENAAWGVIASVTPSTNPAATIINNAISMVAAGNTVVFAPHPAAKKVSQRAISLINESIVAAGGPANVLTTVFKPNIETAQRLFRYPGIKLLVVTGGEAVVDSAREHTDKRLIAAGAGNPPTVVDETADIPRAARDIVYGASFDNNIICADEKEIIVVSSVCDQLKAEMKKNKAVELTAEQAKQLESILLTKIDANGKGSVSRDWVGRDAAKIAAAIGLNVPEDTRLLFVETPANHPFAVTELMMPVLPVIRADNVDHAIELAIKLEGGCLHTASMHSRNLENLNKMANLINTTIFVKNGPCIAGLGFGGEGWTTMTISTPTGEGVSSARTFVRLRRCVAVDALRIV
ncbi:aldehyde dehydrogenase family protein [Neisseria sp. Ec49-e6-T10]|uniref:aldehyde dehydrogenase family protein n=1 Tax=Neisseria sp. Ec49-e6-T10 TaxID=3140744 RepID=UPI003EB97CE0